jgi:hypothetical protein
VQQGGNPQQQQQLLLQSMAQPLAAPSTAASSSSGSILGRSFSPPAVTPGLSLTVEAAGDTLSSSTLAAQGAPYSSTLGRADLGHMQQDLRSSNLTSASHRSSSTTGLGLPHTALTLGATSGNSSGAHLRGRSPTGFSPTAGSPTGFSPTGFGRGPRGYSPHSGSRGASPRAGSRGASPGGSPHGVTYVGPNAAVQAYCTQEILPELNAAVTTLLTTVKDLQDKAIAKNPGKVRTGCWCCSGSMEGNHVRGGG